MVSSCSAVRTTTGTSQSQLGPQYLTDALFQLRDVRVGVGRERNVARGLPRGDLAVAQWGERCTQLIHRQPAVADVDGPQERGVCPHQHLGRRSSR